MAYWPFSTIQSKIRQLAGMPTDIELSPTDLQNEINFYLVEVLPLELMTDSLQGYWNIPVSAELVPLPDSIISLSEPMTLDYGLPSQQYDPNYFFDPLTEDEPDLLYFNVLIVDTQPQKFFQTWPNNQLWEPDRPYAVLYYGRKLLFRPPPDATYTFRSPAFVKASPLANSGDLMLRDLWGQYLAYAVAHKLVAESGDATRMVTLTERKRWAMGLCQHTDLISDGDLMLRPIGRW